MGEFAETLIRGGRMCLGLGEQLLKDVTPQIFARRPSFGGKVIETNHGAFIFGHLAIYPARCLEFLGLDPKAAQVPSNFSDLFAAGKPCLDDPEGKIYPPMKTITEAFFTSHRAAFDAVAKIDDAKLMEPNPREGRMREMFPTKGGMVLFYTSVHPMTHLGQMSAWRRCFGLGSAM